MEITSDLYQQIPNFKITLKEESKIAKHFENSVHNVQRLVNM